MRLCAVNDQRKTIDENRRESWYVMTWYGIPRCNVPAGYTTTNVLGK
jgi:hypothetical protein